MNDPQNAREQDWDDFRLAEWRVEVELNRLQSLEDGSVRQMEPRLMLLLCSLAAEPGRLVTRESLFAHLWPDTHVTDHALTKAVSELRKLLDDSSKSPRFIETVPKKGYRLLVAPLPLEIADTKLPEQPAQADPIPTEPNRITPQKAILGALLVAVPLLVLVFASALKPKHEEVLRLVVLPPQISTEDGSPPKAPYLTNYLHHRWINLITSTAPPELAVIAPFSSSLPAEQREGRLSVDLFLRSQLHQHPQEYELFLQISDAEDRVVWSGAYLFTQVDQDPRYHAVEEEIHGQISGLLPTGRRLKPRPEKDPDPINSDYLKARWLAQQGTDQEEVLTFLDKVSEGDPSFVDTLVLRAELLLVQNKSAKACSREAAILLEKALSLAPDHPGALLAEARRLLVYEASPDAAARVVSGIVIENDPIRTAEKNHLQAAILSAQGKHDDAALLVKTLLQNDPLNPLLWGDLGYFYYFSGDFDKAFTISADCLALDPKNRSALEVTLQSSRFSGRQEEALNAAQQLVPEPQRAEIGSLNDYYQYRLKVLGQYEDQGFYQDPLQKAFIYIDAGLFEEAKQALVDAEQLGALGLVYAAYDPRLQKLRTTSNPQIGNESGSLND